MLIIKRKKGYAYMIAIIEGEQLAVVNQTNSWPVMLTGPRSWTCEHENLPQYMRTWLNQLAYDQKWANP